MKLRTSLCCITLAAASTAVFGEARLVARDQLASSMGDKGYCCVVDARTQSAREQAPILKAVPWRPQLKLNPTAMVVVIADSDQAALTIAKTIERDAAHPDVLAVKGGLEEWQGFLAERSGAPPEGFTFVIPRNTCESGSSIIELKSGIQQ